MRALVLDSIDKAWLKRLGQPETLSGYVFTRCQYWQRGDSEDLAFLYSSQNLTLVSCSRELEAQLTALGRPTSLNDLMLATPDKLDLLDDLDFYLPKKQPLHADNAISNNFESANVETANLIEHKNEMADFLARCDQDDVTRSGFDFDGEYFYVLRSAGKIIGALTSYCGSEPFESLAIIVGTASKGQGIGSALLSKLMSETAKRNRVVRYRSNATNTASIKLATRLGFTEHSKIQLLYSI